MEVFHGSADLQEERKNTVETLAAETAEEWQAAKHERDPDAAQRWMTNTVCASLEDMTPRLKQRHLSRLPL